MKIYNFTFDITGQCNISVKADSEEQAVEKLKNGDLDNEYELDEWDVDYPYHFNKLSLKEVLMYLGGIDEE